MFELDRETNVDNVDCRVDSLNLGDVFILDAGKELYVWMPPESGRLERIKGMELGCHIAQVERHYKTHVNVLDVDWDTDEAFWSYFGGVGQVRKIAKAKDDDMNYWQRATRKIALYRCILVVWFRLCPDLFCFILSHTHIDVLSQIQKKTT
ncbi:unnamed protein product [Cylicostephanus goldi]|uniref:Gelsolin-like domain-containing protein n=1 Tax=Cylicostephanus goldi TaxID=71465 RepID=A0A3P6UH42_CYLGO|nr:unnamed protein product [Cylicostephanus goldi]